MKRILLYTISCVLLLSLFSCDDFLDVKPTSQVDVNASPVIGTAADAKVIMNGIMRKMLESSYYGRNMFLYADAKGGDLCVGSRGRGYDNLYVFEHSPQSGAYGGFWSEIYHCIAQANNLIKGIDALTDAGNGSTDLNLLKAQALTARAIYYYDLVRLYGKPYGMENTSFGVPLILEVLGFDAQPGRNTVAEVYTQIVKDLNDAVTSFGTNRTKNNGYINYYTCKAMQARVYLQMQNYAEALTAAQVVIAGGYTLYSNSDWVSSWSRQFQSESIFELAMLPTENDLERSSLGSMTINANTHSSYTNWDYFIASDDFLARLGEDPDDVRWGVMNIDEKSGTIIRRGCCYKYLGGTTSTVGDGKSTRTAVNIKLIRLSEIYLIAAEAALLMQPADKDTAAYYLKSIYKRSPTLYVTNPITASNITLEMIQNERSKELLTEGHRFFDMMRWNKTINYTSGDGWAGSTITSRPPTIDRTFYKAILPIAQREINANAALRSQQNPQY